MHDAMLRFPKMSEFLQPIKSKNCLMNIIRILVRSETTSRKVLWLTRFVKRLSKPKNYRYICKVLLLTFLLIQSVAAVGKKVV